MKHSDFVDTHRQCWELLPWLANERAGTRDVALVEEHLRDCRECREELELQRGLRDAIRKEDAVVLAPQTSLQKLMQRIDADTPVFEPAAVISGPRRRPDIRRWRWLPIAAGIQGIVIAALVGNLWWQSRAQLSEPRFTTLTSHAVLARGPVIRVVFAEGVALAEVNEILRAIDAQIVAGPSEAGVYTLGISATEHVETALAQLRADGRIVFSESALARSETP